MKVQYQMRINLSGKVFVCVYYGEPQINLAVINAGQLLLARREAFSHLSRVYPDASLSDVKVVLECEKDFVHGFIEFGEIREFEEEDYGSSC